MNPNFWQEWPKAFKFHKYVSFIFHTGININCKKCKVVAIMVISRLTPIYVLKNYEKRTCPAFDPVTPLTEIDVLNNHRPKIES